VSICEKGETKTSKMSELKELIQDKLNKESFSGNGSLKALSQKGLELFNEQGIPTVKHEEWMYSTKIFLMQKELQQSLQKM
jgi:Fe-S cluster assembly protein SufD